VELYSDVSVTAVFRQGPTGAETPQPVALELGPIRPNPAIETARIAYGLPRAAHVRLSILDVSGREVAVLVDETRPAGRYESAWGGATGPSRGSGVAPGVYFVRLVTPEATLVRRVLLAR
jgi:hypothetical protein